jgi:hypothetical protein
VSGATADLGDDTAIDAVITWVDGRDPAHAARLAAFLGDSGKARPAAAHPTRFDDAGEIEWCLASIVRHAPWIRRVHIVTDQQVPPLMARLAGTAWADRVRVVDHRTTFAGHEANLPTFNSRAIITTLWRIPDLADRFVYFNDDFVLLRPVAADDFFRADGRRVLRGDWRPQSHRRPLRRLVEALRRAAGRDPKTSAAARVRNLAAQEESARLGGFADDYLRLYHNPFPMRRSTLARWFAAHPDQLERNLRPRLRAADQFKTEALAAHLEAAQGTAVLDNRLRTLQLKPAEQWLPRMRRKMAQADADPRTAFAVVQSLDQAPAATQTLLRDWLDARIGRLDAALTRAA